MSDDFGSSTVLDKIKVVIVDRQHPIWRILNIAVIGVFVILFAMVNAENFDETEWKMIVEFLLALSGYEGMKAFTNRSRQA